MSFRFQTIPFYYRIVNLAFGSVPGRLGSPNCYDSMKKNQNRKNPNCGPSNYAGQIIARRGFQVTLRYYFDLKSATPRSFATDSSTSARAACGQLSTAVAFLRHAMMDDSAGWIGIGSGRTKVHLLHRCPSSCSCALHASHPLRAPPVTWIKSFSRKVRQTDEGGREGRGEAKGGDGHAADFIQ